MYASLGLSFCFGHPIIPAARRRAACVPTAHEAILICSSKIVYLFLFRLHHACALSPRWLQRDYYNGQGQP